MIPLPTKKPNKLHERPKSRFVFCSQCGFGWCLASGYNAHDLTKPVIAKIAREKGWKTVPLFICPRCQSPVTQTERLRAHFLNERVMYARKDHQQLALTKCQLEFDRFISALVIKYGQASVDSFKSYEKI